MPNQFDLIVWDWDGTLADSTGMITQAILKAADQVGLPVPEAKAARNIIGLGLRESIHILFGDISEEKAIAVGHQYSVNYYVEEKSILMFDGVKSAIIALNRRGYKQAVATGKSRKGLNFALEHSGLGNYFQATRTVDECFSKPHPQMLNELMDVLVVMPERTLMIGDTSYDLQMAKNAGVKSVGVTYGAQHEEQLNLCKPLMMFDNFATLSEWLLAHA